jgi:O-antigen biosynthesis alpha-1,2-mannosyltransferase
MAAIALDATYTVDPMPSGISIYSRRLIEALASLGADHHFKLCYRLSRFGQRRGFLCPVASGKAKFSVHFYQQPLTFWLPWRADLFHSLAQRRPAFRFRREVATIHDVFPLTGRDYSTPDFQRKFSRLLLDAAHRAQRIITGSKYTAIQLQEHASVDPAKIRVVPYGVSPPSELMTRVERGRERATLGRPEEILILSVGVVQTRKNTLNALRALALLPPNYRLVLAGGDGYGSEAIHEHIRREGLSARVVRLQYVEPARLSRLYQAADVFLFPSLEEGFGLPVLEAMSYGLPSVLANTSSLPEVGGAAALYADPHEPADIAAKVREAAEDAALRQRMIAAGRVRAREFTWERTARLTLEVYEEVLRDG